MAKNNPVPSGSLRREQGYQFFSLATAFMPLNLCIA